jgi:hypothetical protein
MSETVIAQSVKQWLNNKLSGFDSRRSVYLGPAQLLTQPVQKTVFNKTTKTEAWTLTYTSRIGVNLSRCLYRWLQTTRARVSGIRSVCCRLCTNCLFSALTYVKRSRPSHAYFKAPDLWQAPRPRAAVDNSIWAQAHESVHTYGHSRGSTRMSKRMNNLGAL